MTTQQEFLRTAMAELEMTALSSPSVLDARCRRLTNGYYLRSQHKGAGCDEGQLSIDVSDAVWRLLEDADVDAKNRKIIWPDEKRLSITESVKRIHADYPDFALDLIENHLIGWLEMGFAPPNYSQDQLDELDQLTEKWVEDHRR